MIRENR